MAQPHVLAGDLQALDPQVRDHERPEGQDVGLRRREPGVVGQDALHRDGSAGPGRVCERPCLPGVHPGGSREPSCRGTGAHGRGQRGGTGPRSDQDQDTDQEHRHGAEHHSARRDEPGLPGNQPGGNRRQGQPKVQRVALDGRGHTRTRALSC